MDTHSDQVLLRLFYTPERMAALTEKERHALKTSGGPMASYAKGRFGLQERDPDAEKWLLDAAAGGVNDAILTLAMLYATVADEGDFGLALRLIQAVADEGSELAAIEYARIRALGSYGAPKEPEIVVEEIKGRLEEDILADRLWYTVLGQAYDEADQKVKALETWQLGSELGEAKCRSFLEKFRFPQVEI